MASVQCGAGLPVSSKLWRAQSPLRQFPAGSRHWLAVGQHDYVRASAAEFSPHSDWQGVCLVFSSDHQRHDVNHNCQEQPAVASNDLDRLDLGPWKRERDRQHAEWELGLSGLQQRWDD